ncbi:MAG TPA: PQQ-binding-like beta-propeller repeat protein [Rugosimonospora sp.]|nr:PQQ-binding-like beta-propeller repeat protein [Rugosimonospora sp.]
MRRWHAGYAVLTLLLIVSACGSSSDSGKAGSPTVTETAPAPAPTASPAPSSPSTDWPTYHHDNARTGVAPGFAKVTKLSLAWKAPLDGAVYGQPLVIGDLLLAATEHDTVYGLDAATGKVRWSTHVGTPVRRSKLPCGNIDPLGITSTMVYDPATHLVFALAETTGGQHTLYGLDISTGAVKLRRVAEPPKGDRLAHQQRSALNLLNGKVYISYGGLAGDCAQYIGSVVSVPTTGTGPIASYAVPTTREAGLWTPGGATLYQGKLLYSVGNGESAGGTYDGSDSVIALDPDLKLVDRYSPTTWAEDNAADLDLGSMSPALVGNHVYIAGKRGVGYVLDADKLGNIGGQLSQANVCRGFGGASVDGDTVYVPCTDGPRAVKVGADGSQQVLWHAATAAPGAPVVGGGVWTVDYDGGVLFVLDQATGNVAARVSIGKAPHFASPTLAGGRGYVGTLAGITAVTAG